MRFAKWVFLSSGAWGLAVLTPLFWLVDITGRSLPAPADYPQFFYGFLVIAVAWQMAFLAIGTAPARFRLLMIPAMIEKLGYVSMLILMRGQSRISALDAQPAWPDLVLGLLFVAAFAKTRPQLPSNH
jgi:hypothetical protein